MLNILMLSCIKLRLASALDVSTISRGFLTPQREKLPACPGRRRVAIVNMLVCLRSRGEGKELQTVIILLRLYDTSKTNLNSSRAES